MKKELTTTSTSVLLVLTIYPIITYSTSHQGNSCECVAFRLDDVQDHYLDKVNMDIIKVFKEKNASLTIGIIGNFFGQDKPLISFIKNRINENGPDLEISNHGWNHEDFRRYSVDDQSSFIARTNERISKILGITPITFIAPFDVFNNDTLAALKENGMKYISSFIDYDLGPYGINEDRMPYHFPSTATTSNNNNTHWWGVKHTTTFKHIQKSILNYGFAVVEMHPYEYSNKSRYYSEPFDVNDKNSTFSFMEYVRNWDKAGIDLKQIKELQLLIDDVRAKGYKIVSIDKLDTITDKIQDR